MSEKHLLRNAMDFYCLFCNSKRTPYAQTPTKSLERILSKLLFVMRNARFSLLDVHWLLQPCVYFVNSPRKSFRDFARVNEQLCRFLLQTCISLLVSSTFFRSNRDHCSVNSKKTAGQKDNLAVSTDRLHPVSVRSKGNSSRRSPFKLKA